MDWKKEYRISDLFRRQKKERRRAIPPAGETGLSQEMPARSPLDDGSIWKREIKLSGLFRRKKSTQPRRGPLALPPAGDTVPEAPTPEQPPVTAVEQPAGATPEMVAATPEPEPVLVPASEAEPAQPSPVLSAAPPEAEPAQAETVPTESAEPTGQPDPAPQASGPQAAQAAAGETPAAAEAAASAPTAEAAARKTPWYKRELGGRKKVKPAPVADAGPVRREKQAQPKDEPGPARKPAKTGDLSRVPLMKAMNLLPKDVQLASRTQVRPVFIHVAALLAALLVAGGVGLLYVSQRSTLHDEKSALEDLSAQAAELQAKVKEADAGRVNGSSLAGEALQRATALSAALKARVNWDRLLRELSLTLPSGVWFDGMQSAAASTPAVATGSTAVAAPTPSGPSGLTITGFAMDQDGIARLLARLAVIPEFSSIQLQSATQTDQGSTPVIKFSLVGQLKPRS